MEKEQILSTLNEKLEAEGIKTESHQRTLGNRAERIAKKFTETDPDDAFWADEVSFLKDYVGEVSHEVAARVEDFKKNYKPETKPGENGGSGESGKIGDLEKQIKDLKKLFGEQRTKNAADALRKEVENRGESLKVANKAIWEDAVNSVEVGEKDSETEVIAKAKNAYERMLKRYMGDGAAPYGSSGRQGATKEAEEAAKDKREALKKKMQARGRLPKTE